MRQEFNELELCNRRVTLILDHPSGDIYIRSRDSPARRGLSYTDGTPQRQGKTRPRPKEIRNAAPPAAPSGASAPKQKIVSLYVPEKGKKTQIITGSPAEAAKELVRRLREEARVI